MNSPDSLTARKEPKLDRNVKSGAPQNLLFLFFAVILWGVLVSGGYFFSKQYFDRSIQTIQQTNAINIQALEERLDALAVDIQAIEEGLGDAGQSLSSSDFTQKELNSKIEDLDKQLKELEKSLMALKEAPNAGR